MKNIEIFNVSNIKPEIQTSCLMKNSVKFGTNFNVQNEFIEEFLRLKKIFITHNKRI